jgi:Mrp family chromosome partitioning ATPase
MTRTRKPTRRRKPAYTPVATVNTIEVPPDSPLTTKEGWAAFVRHTPQPPQSLTASPLMAMSPKDRARHEDRLRDYHADLPLVNTPTIQKVISTGRLLIQLNRRQISARRGMVISGMSGTGKTTALTQLGRAHELAIRRRFPDDGDRLPVIYVTVPPAATPRMLAVEFARFLGLEFPARANVTDITDAVCSVAAHTRVDLVLVDEIHNISLATRAGAEVSDQLKYFNVRYLQPGGCLAR